MHVGYLIVCCFFFMPRKCEAFHFKTFSRSKRGLTVTPNREDNDTRQSVYHRKSITNKLLPSIVKARGSSVRKVLYNVVRAKHMI